MKSTQLKILFALTFASLSTSVHPQEGAELEYDPAPFLGSMVTLRTAAVTCDKFVANSPNARTQPIAEFFKALNQELPDLVDSATQTSLDKFVGSQAAALCRDKLEAAYQGYQAQAQVYLASKPEDWPAAPQIVNGPWCSSENCLEF